jgi:hypothetical protein
MMVKCVLDARQSQRAQVPAGVERAAGPIFFHDLVTSVGTHVVEGQYLAGSGYDALHWKTISAAGVLKHDTPTGANTYTPQSARLACQGFETQ